MAINSGDIALVASQVMDDVPEGGGRPTANVIPDGASNGIFNDISEVDRAGGRVNMRKVFPSVRTLNTDGYYGANVIVAETPHDPKVSITLFSTNDTFDTRANAKSRVESYLALGATYPGYLFGNHIEGQSIVTLLQALDLPIPVQGDTLALRVHEIAPPPYEQYVKALRVASRIREFEDEKGKFKLMEVIITMTDALSSDFRGFDASRTGPSGADQQYNTKIYSTIVADASRYYGATTLKRVAAVGDLAIQVSSIFTQLVPSTRVEVPVSDARVTQRKSALIKAGEPYTFQAYVTFNATQALYIGGKILPGTLSVSASSITLADNGGLLYNGAVAVGSIDYANGILRLGANVFGNGQIMANVTYTPADGPISVTSSIGIPVTIQNQRLSWVFSADSLPARGTAQVSFRAFAQWYTLTDDGSGALRGVDRSFGAGSINYATGSITVTLGAMPDVGSQIIVQWVDTASATTISKMPVVGANLPQAFGKSVSLNQAISPGTLVLSWDDGRIRTATDSGGLLSGDASGEVNYVMGKIMFRPNTLPKANTVISLTLSKGTPQASAIGSFNDGNTRWTFIVPGPVKPRSFEMEVIGAYTMMNFDASQLLYKDLFHVVDDGTGNLVIANGASPLLVGTINYATGACTLNKANPQFNQVQYAYTMLSNGITSVTPVINNVVISMVELSITNDQLGIAIISNGEHPWKWHTAADTANVAVCRYIGADGNALNLTFPFDTLFMPTATPPTAFNLGSKRYFATSENSYMCDISYATGIGASVADLAIVDGYYGIQLSKWEFGVGCAVSNVAGVISQGTQAVTSAITFRTAISPLFPSGFTVSGTMQDGTLYNVTGDADGYLKNDAIGIYGKVDYITGVATVHYGTKVDDAKSTAPGVIDISYLGIPDVKYIKVKAALVDPIRYNAVGYSYLPIDQNILGLNPVRLPADGRVPIFRAGGFSVIGNTQTIKPVQVSNNQTIDCGRVRLSRMRVLDAAGVVLNNGFSVDLENGKIKILDISLFMQPITIEHRIEDMVLMSDVQIGGQITFTRQLTHDYPIDGTTISSALILGDLHARVSTIFDQTTWTNLWIDQLIGNDAIATFNAVLAPIQVTNKGTLTERWAIVFQTSSTFMVIGEHVGVIANGTINVDCAPQNPASGVPYFTIPSLGWGQGWAVGNVLRFNTVGASPPIWVVRTILQGAPSVGNDQFTLLIRGDVDNPN